MSGSAALAFERCMAVGGLALFPADTVYGLACDAQNATAVRRLYRLKRRRLEKPSAVMFFDVELALAALPELGPRTRGALDHLLPGRVTVLVPNPAGRFPLACGDDPGTLGLRVPSVNLLRGVGSPVLQSSANSAGARDAQRLGEVPEPIRAGVDLVLDGGELPGTPSTVIDLRDYEQNGAWTIVRHGAVDEPALRAALEWQYHFDPATYVEMIRSEVPAYDHLQDELVSASGADVRRVLELGTGTGETARRLLARHADARLVGIDVSEPMLAAARALLPADRVELRAASLEDDLPRGPFDLVASALCVHHLAGAAKAELFARIRDVLAPGGRLVLADVVVPADPRDAVTPLTTGYDHPSALSELLVWLSEAGFDARVKWTHADLVVLVADLVDG
jgi:tRNA threonylcarbamoyl adenosine modification protein (Sua5/YciO/YrdC/YwlC family)